jgi:hypothetical protein
MRKGFAMADGDALREAHAGIVRAIAELRLMRVPVPVALHRAAHSHTHCVSTETIRSLCFIGLAHDEGSAPTSKPCRCSGRCMPHTLPRRTKPGAKPL